MSEQGREQFRSENDSCSCNSAGSNYWSFRELAETTTKRNSGLLSGEKPFSVHRCLHYLH